MADAATEGQPADSGVAHEPTGHGQSVELRLPVHILVEAPTLRDDRLGNRIHMGARHRRQVDEDSAVGDGVARDRVAAAADGEVVATLPAESDDGGDVGGSTTAGDERRATLDLAVPDLARRVVRSVVRSDQLADEVGPEVLKVQRHSCSHCLQAGATNPASNA